MLDDKDRHFPANPSRFEFDEEVSAIFPTMAHRSIPNFQQAHHEHAAMVSALTSYRQRIDVLDIGASRGAFITELMQAIPRFHERCTVTALEKSNPMRNYLIQDFPFARVHAFDLETEEIEGQYDVISLHYVLQFLAPDTQQRALRKVLAALRPGGILVFGHKARGVGALAEAAHERYIRFRVSQGYTPEEINAKTAALAGSMHCMDHDMLLADLQSECREVHETFRYMMFSTLIAVK